jgi:hypothetical protein
MREYEQTTTLTRDIVFNGQRYRINVPVTSTLDWKAYRFGYQFDFVRTDRVFAGFILDLKQTHVNATLATVFPGLTEFARVRAPIPAIGGVVRGYVVPNISITGEVTWFTLPDRLFKDSNGHYFDVDIYGTVNFTNYVGVQVGYRSFDVAYLVDTDTGSFTLKGLFFDRAITILRKTPRTQRERAALMSRRSASPTSLPACSSRSAAWCVHARVLVEVAPRNGGDPHVSPGAARTRRRRGAERADVGHDVVRAVRLVAGEAVALEDFEQHVAQPLILRREVEVVLIGQAERDRACLLERRRRADRQEIVHLANRAGQRRRRDGPAHTPAGHAVGLRQAVDRDRSSAIPPTSPSARADGRRKGCAVDLVGDGNRIPRRHNGDRFEIGARTPCRSGCSAC